jgi:uncharacterized repeat protein (TIGR02543 family)
MSAIVTTGEPTRKGFSFVGWAQSSSATSTVSSFTITANTTLYAVWKTETTSTIVTTPGPTSALPSLLEALGGQAISATIIGDVHIPLVAPSGYGAWLLFDLVATILAVICAFIAAIRFVLARSREQKAEGGL